jgi:hypothetical protein
MAPVGRPPQRVRIADGQMLALEYGLHRMDDQTAVSSEALGAVRPATVFQ